MDLYIRASEIKNNYNLILYRNRNESTFNVCMVTFSDHDDGTYFLWASARYRLTGEKLPLACGSSPSTAAALR